MSMNIALLYCALFSICVALASAKSDSKIFFGSKVSSTSGVPYIVAIYNTKKSGVTCGGMLFSTRLVVTACNCLSYLAIGKKPTRLPLGRFRFIAGESHKDRMLKDGQVRKTVATYFHPKCERLEKIIIYDISIAKMNEVFKITPQVQVLDIEDWDVDSFRSKAYSMALMNVTCKMAGWGKTASRREENDLKVIAMYLINEYQCNEIWSLHDPTLKGHSFYQHHQYCTLNSRLMEDTCRGDSGGPYYCGNYPIGIIQNGFGPCGNLEPTIVTSFSLLIEWWNENDNPVRQELHKKSGYGRSRSNPSQTPQAMTLTISLISYFILKR
ncbi:Hypothetical protein NTJ_10336 [Nesidiocoris tenuis]|uniref:Peptidase S1 domain-containing protein n=1 Tax=Nesidiocoris tenuis TaxID=355587 RepID=A0ABN7B450_9HEMI|nr:Hypothetical protein NTJ_10336 [Nesidiocoris tenuis]